MLRSLTIVVLAASSFAQDRSNPAIDPLWNALECQEAKTPVTITGTVLLPSGIPAEGAVVVSSAGGMARTDRDGAYRLTVNLPAGSQSVQVTAVGSNMSATRQVSGFTSSSPISTGPLSMQVTAGCQPAWLPTFGSMPGTDGDVLAMTTFDDGNGPALYLGGNFLNTGDTEAHYIARWNGSTWSALGSGMDNAVQALAVFDDGSGPALYAGGLFTSAGGVQVNGIAKWSGSTWSSLGVGMNGGVDALAVYDDGAGPALYAGGLFTYAGGSPAHSIARWNGTQWSALGIGVNSRVRALCAHDDGTGTALYVGGEFTTAGGGGAVRIARWQSGSWSPVGVGFNGAVYALASFDDGSGAKLYAAGQLGFPFGGWTYGAATWDGAAWTALGPTGLSPGTYRSLATFNSGSGQGLYAGYLQGGQAYVLGLAGAGGVNFGGADGEVEALASFDDGTGAALCVGGRFSSVGTVRALHVAKVTSTTVSAVGSGGLSATVHATAVFDDGTGPSLYVGSTDLFRWSGSSWVSCGSPGSVFSLAVYDDGSGPMLFVGYDYGVMRWTGSAWSGGFSGGNSAVYAMAVYDDGSGPALYFGGAFNYFYLHIAKHSASGTGWAGPGLNGTVLSLAVYDDGSGPALYAGGEFTGTSALNGYYHIARWDGASWTQLGTGLDGDVHCIRTVDLGFGPELYVAGGFGLAGGVPALNIVRWDGTVWHALGGGLQGGPVYAIGDFDDGSGTALFAGGNISVAGSTAVNNIAMWNGFSWSPVGSGCSGLVTCFGAFDNADCRGPTLVAGGGFNIAYDSHDSFIARYGCSAPGTSPGCYGGFCFGDVLSNCPCGNVGAPGHGCANSGGTGASLNGSGAASLAGDTLVLTSSGELPTVLSIFLQGTTQIAPTPFGDGLRCVGGSLKRLYTKHAVAGVASAPSVGDLSVAAMSAALGDPLAAGSTRYLQTYYRDSVLSFCPSPQGNSFNVSSGIVVTWAP